MKNWNQNNKKEDKKIIYPVHEMEQKGTLILPSHIVTQINYLHGKVGKDEWSAMLMYDVKSGSPAKPEEFVLVAKHIFLMDIGTSASTEYEADGDIVDIYNNIEEAMEWKTGHIHSHHSMGAFFSGTDMSELNDNVDKHNYYLSLIVNFDSKYDCKVAFLSDVSTTSHMSYTDDGGKLRKFDIGKEEKHMVTIDMDIYYEYNDKFFYDRYYEVIEKKKKASAKLLSYNNSKYKNNNSSFYDPHEHSISQQIIPFDVDPQNMKTIHVEKLARNIFSVTPELNEVRSVYQILHVIAGGSETNKSVYFSLLRQNIQLIIENFFDQDLELEEMNIVLGEVSASMLRFANTPALQELISGISEVLIEFLTSYEEDLRERDFEEGVITEQNDEEILLELEAGNL